VTSDAPNRLRDPLPYESGIPGALRPGERVLFESRPDASPVRQAVVPRVGLVVVISFMVAVAAAAVTSDAVVSGAAGVLAVIVVGAAVFLGGGTGGDGASLNTSRSASQTNASCAWTTGPAGWCWTLTPPIPTSFASPATGDVARR
jgi:hypothetical protein